MSPWAKIQMPHFSKRLALIVLLAVGGSCVVLAQEKSEAPSEEKVEKATENPTTETWKWINFVLLAAGLGYLIGKNAPGVFRSRTATIQKDITEAQAAKKDAETRAAAVDARVQALGAEMNKFREQSKAEMQQEGERIRQETARLMAHLETQASGEIEAAGKVAKRELKEYSAKLALELAEQRIRTSANAATESGLVDAFLSDLGRQTAKGSNN
jgi:F-type H+-transporting ATPase subunit b